MLAPGIALSTLTSRRAWLLQARSLARARVHAVATCRPSLWRALAAEPDLPRRAPAGPAGMGGPARGPAATPPPGLCWASAGPAGTDGSTWDPAGTLPPGSDAPVTSAELDLLRWAPVGSVGTDDTIRDPVGSSSLGFAAPGTLGLLSWTLAESVGMHGSIVDPASIVSLGIAVPGTLGVLVWASAESVVGDDLSSDSAGTSSPRFSVPGASATGIFRATMSLPHLAPAEAFRFETMVPCSPTCRSRTVPRLLPRLVLISPLNHQPSGLR
mmetsp:Transcript_11605/g.32842  ORF Transcript_11605/g.32842 Transcript_11605/m.32842 type:complete len:270 (-) Transcript_11605:434-1243(-)